MKPLALILLIALGASQAHASDSHMVWRGVIDSRFLATFEARKNTISDLYLESHGGDYPVALRVGREVRTLGIRTHVDSFCESACSMIYQGGVKRYATHDALFLYHPPSIEPYSVALYIRHCSGDYKLNSCPARFETMTARNWMLFHEWVAFFISLGAPRNFESLARSQGIGEPWGVRGNFTELSALILTAQQAKRLGFVTTWE